ncbi:MAG: FKBP-type peptidyl-prolyl cis-trans isomerase [Fibrobacter sp.]|jgi:FKBP-type peptidyl-prolyl cis-trans isomerase FkpA/FKBP-type peptidyl-prolyl cis-trans isomerase FklB|uniref:FKBP-type peptidyl-prolyl cis-trans isomerase n=1 Tax=uncultured Fibrobacter sp. TaxID=261512 RepID=UPI0025FF0985|nr:FKBP-type peptidyl-prolyl cis-trans isomerase [uncultured Fibrobacter sp.]MBQ1824410.1 FKBP-type peptidyl-prolyl cis-trans isomerase [Fibrobacter sp.]
MNFAKYFTAFLGTLALVACGGSKDVAPVVDPTPAPEAKPAKVTLDSAIDRYSYALGMDLGKAIANVNIPLKMDVLMAAILDETDSTRPVLLNDTAAEAALQDLLLQMQKKKEADEAASAKKALDEQAAFLAKNIMDSTVKTTPKGVQYKVLKDSTGISPKASDKVKVHYIGSLLNGTEFDNSVKRGEPLEFPVNAVIEGWQDLLQVMKEGMKVKAWIPSALAYGEAGVPPLIPANSLLVFEVELLKVYAETPDSAAVVPAAPANAAAEASTGAAATEPAAAPEAAKPAAKAEKKPAEKKPAAKK